MSTLLRHASTSTGLRLQSRVGGAALNLSLLRWCQRIGDVSLAVMLFVVPLTTTGIRDTGVALLILFSILFSLSWAASELLRPVSNTRFSGAEVVLAGAVLLISLQLMPLGQESLLLLAPAVSELLPFWTSPHAAGTLIQEWTTISLTPHLTRSGLSLLLGYVLFSLTLLHRLRTEEDLGRTIRMIGYAAAAMSVIGIAQVLFGNGLSLWMFEHPTRNNNWPARATFTNQNHFAHFLALGVGPLIWSWKEATRSTGHVVRSSTVVSGFGMTQRDSRNSGLLAAMIAVVGLAGLLTISRGGVASLLLAFLISSILIAKNFGQLLRLFLPVAGFVTVAFVVFGTEQFQNRWQAIVEADSLEELSIGRFALWEAILQAVPHFQLLGSGLGSHAEVYPIWLTTDFGVRFSHAENGYLQVLLETGLCGLLLTFAALSLCVYWCISALRSPDQRTQHRSLVLGAGLMVSALHSLVDFPWYIPGCMVPTIVLAVCACRNFQLSRSHQNYSDPGSLSSKTAIAALLLCFVSSALLIQISLPLAATEHERQKYLADVISASRRSTYESDTPLEEQLNPLIQRLERCVQLDPQDFEVRSDLAALYLHRFETGQEHADNNMPLSDIRTTVRQAGFESPRDVGQWMFRAFGPGTFDLYRAHFMAGKALQGQPLRGENYLTLAKTGFLMGMSPESEQALLEQAVELRPHNAPILYSVGLGHIERGDLPKAFELWREAFRVDRTIRSMLLQHLIPLFPMSEIVSQLDIRQEGLWDLFLAYRRHGTEDQIHEAALKYTAVFPKIVQASSTNTHLTWLNGYETFQCLGKHAEAVSCLGRAVKVRPTDYSLRRKLAIALVTTGQIPEAIRQLEWCLLRTPDDKELTQALQNARQQLLTDVDRSSL